MNAQGRVQSLLNGTSAPQTDDRVLLRRTESRQEIDTDNKLCTFWEEINSGRSIKHSIANI